MEKKGQKFKKIEFIQKHKKILARMFFKIWSYDFSLAQFLFKLFFLNIVCEGY